MTKRTDFESELAGIANDFFVRGGSDTAETGGEVRARLQAVRKAADDLNAAMESLSGHQLAHLRAYFTEQIALNAPQFRQAQYLAGHIVMDDLTEMIDDLSEAARKAAKDTPAKAYKKTARKNAALQLSHLFEKHQKKFTGYASGEAVECLLRVCKLAGDRYLTREAALQIIKNRVREMKAAK